MAETDRPLPDIVDAALRDWRQGDCVLGEQWFLFRSDPESPLTPEAAEATAEGDDTVDAEVHVFLWFLREEVKEDQGLRWEEHLKLWLALLPPSGRFRAVDGVVATLDDLSARNYVESDPLDLDHLSLSTND